MRAGSVVDIISGSFGAGHDAAAAEIARRLDDAGVGTRCWDVVDLMPGPVGRVLRAAYLRQMRAAPGSWGRLFGGLERHPSLARRASSLVGVAASRIGELARDGLSAGFVSTHPFASQALGRLRAKGRLPVPAVTYLTDMSVHPMWVHPGVDLHLALHELPAAAATTHAATEVQVVRPAVPARFIDVDRSTPRRNSVRSALGLPAGSRLALLTGGAFGIGDLEQAATEVAATGSAIPVVLCGHNHRLRHRLRRHDRVVALGWVDDVAELLGAVDVVIQNAGGFTSLESLAARTPVVTYRCIPGHGEANAAALHSAGLVPWLRTVEDLRSGVIRASDLQVADLGSPSARLPDVTTAILDRLRPTRGISDRMSA
jgi:UDP-N-acetylglucosamine:LPS N-acetylglucosamine transferase